MPMYPCNNCGEQCNSELESCIACGLRQFWLPLPNELRRWSKCLCCNEVLIWRDQPEKCPRPNCQQIKPLEPRFGMLSPFGKAWFFWRRYWPYFLPAWWGWGMLITYADPLSKLFGWLTIYFIWRGLLKLQRGAGVWMRRHRRLEAWPWELKSLPGQKPPR